MNLQDAIDLFEDSDLFEFRVKTRDDDTATVKFQDESGLRGNDCDRFFVCGFEFGPQRLIHARSYEAAWEAWVDESETIPESELVEAYGIVDDYRAEFDALPSPEGESTAAWCERFYAWCRIKLEELDEAARDGRGEFPELIEGYEYQSNASGTGIVSMGHYAWMNEIDASDIEVVRKEVEPCAK